MTQPAPAFVFSSAGLEQRFLTPTLRNPLQLPISKHRHASIHAISASRIIKHLIFRSENSKNNTCQPIFVYSTMP